MGVKYDPQVKTNLRCNKCGTAVYKETEPELIDDPLSYNQVFYCPECDENLGVKDIGPAQ